MSLLVKGQIDRGNGYNLQLDLELPNRGVTAIVGASGSGKTTLLRAIAGLDYAPDLSVSLDGTSWQDSSVRTPAHLRPVSMVLQHAGLFPHLTVLGNLQFPKRRREGYALDLEQAIERFSLASLLHRKPASLSGGEQQRVALARALLAPSQLWLLDEPLSSLDAIARRELTPLLAKLCRELGQPVLYVTHALHEVLQIADYIVVLENGCVAAAGKPDEVGRQIDHPISAEIDVGAILACEFASFDPEHNLSRLNIGPEILYVRGDLASLGPSIRLQIPARAISIARSDKDQSSMLNRLPVTISEVGKPSAGSVLVTLDCAGQTLFARITSLSVQRLGLSSGDSVFASIKSVALDARNF
ncbi:MAG: molybdenum ABC transporter ATP-binding protein [Gammaproteobacteria bacterium]|nr:molybdenum ABC transporter ATP-binding protein [Gammaproteobacteria bacterium]